MLRYSKATDKTWESFPPAAVQRTQLRWWKGLSMLPAWKRVQKS